MFPHADNEDYDQTAKMQSDLSLRSAYISEGAFSNIATQIIIIIIIIANKCRSRNIAFIRIKPNLLETEFSSICTK